MWDRKGKVYAMEKENIFIRMEATITEIGIKEKWKVMGKLVTAKENYSMKENGEMTNMKEKVFSMGSKTVGGRNMKDNFGMGKWKALAK